MTHPHESSMLAILDMRESLDKAMHDAGGGRLELPDLEEMSALDLLLHLAPNRIRFEYKPSLIVKPIITPQKP